MENVKLMFREIVAQRLSGAPESTAKGELIEELAENLCCRYDDMIKAGVEDQEAKDRAVDALGETDELVEYLKSLEPDQPLPEMILDPEKPDGGQIEEILHNVEDILRGALHKAKSAIKEVRDNMMESAGTKPTVEEPEVNELDGDEKPGSWKVTYHSKKGSSVEIDAESIKKSMKDMMKDVERAIRDAADTAKDACKSAKEATEKACEDISAACAGDTVVAADQPIEAAQLKGIDVQTGGGNVTVRMNQDPDSDVLVGGDIDGFEVYRSEQGVLTIRPVKTETSGFFLGRGIFSGSTSADVELDLPCRSWEFLKITTASGDVELCGEAPVEQVVISTVSGEIVGKLASCTQLTCRATNGDVEWVGDAAGLRMESVSGDLRYHGRAHGVNAKTTSGDITVEGGFQAAFVRTISGDVCLRSQELPTNMDVGTTSGDMWVDIPDAGPFTARFRSVSGDFTSDFFTGRMGGRSCVFNYRGGGENQYGFASVSGDVEIRKYR